MDYLSSLPDAVLSIMHHLVYTSGGLRSALHFEAASKKLSVMFRKYYRLTQDIYVKRPVLLRYITRSTTACPSFSFSRWLAAHGHRLDNLTLDELQLQPGKLALCGQPGLTQVSTLTIISTNAPVRTLESLEGLVNLVQLKCRGVGAAARYGTGGVVSLEPLGLLTALKSLELADRKCLADSEGASRIGTCTAISSLAPLSSLTNLTELRLFGLEAPTISLAALASLSPTLSSLTCLVRDVNMDPVSSLTNLTSLSWAANEIVDLEPIGKLLKLRSLHIKVKGDPVDLDLQPLSTLEVLQTLWFDGWIHPISMLPLVALGSTLQELTVGECQANTLEGIQATFSQLSALTRLEVYCGSPLDFLSPLSLLKQLKVCCDDCDSLEPIQQLTSLTQLMFDQAYGVTSLAPLSLLGRLQHLSLISFDNLSSLQPLSTLTALRSLELMSCASISSVQPLSLLGCLQQLHLLDMYSLSSLQPLSTLTALKSVELEHCASVSSLAPLAALAGLQQVTLYSCRSIDQSSCSSLQSALPGLILLVRSYRG